jgi:hypothetical protein
MRTLYPNVISWRDYLLRLISQQRFFSYQWIHWLVQAAMDEDCLIDALRSLPGDELSILFSHGRGSMFREGLSVTEAAALNRALLALGKPVVSIIPMAYLSCPSEALASTKFLMAAAFQALRDKKCPRKATVSTIMELVEMCDQTFKTDAPEFGNVRAEWQRYRKEFKGNKMLWQDIDGPVTGK